MDLYQRLLGPAYETLHPHVRLAHVPPLRATGMLEVVHGKHPLTAVLVRLMHLPSSGLAQPVVLRLTAAALTPDGWPSLRWTRQIGVARLETRQCASAGHLVERCGPGSLAFSLRADAGALIYEQAAFRIAGVTWPSPVAPRVRARVAPEADGWFVDVTIDWRGSLICRYYGSMQVERAA